MLIDQMKKRLTDRRRQLRMETLEPRQLLTTGSISGTVFDDLNADGIRNTGEPGLSDWIVTLERTDTPSPGLTLLNPTPEENDHFGTETAFLRDDILVGCHQDDITAHNAGAVYLYDGASGDD